MQLSAIISIVRLVWPYLREIWKNKDARHSIGKNRVVNLMFVLFLLSFGLSLYSIAHGFGLHNHYTRRLGEMELKLDRASRTAELLQEARDENKRLRARLGRTEASLQSTSNVLSEALSELPEGVAERILNKEMEATQSPTARRTIWDRLDDLNNQHTERRGRRP